VEGDETSLDIAIYRACFSEWTVIPRGSCENVIHSVVTMRHNQELTRVTCSGMVDADDYQPEDIRRLNALGISVLPVSEIENVILLPSVSIEIARTEGFEGQELENQLASLKASVFSSLNSQRAINDVVVRYCRRRIDRSMKKLDLSAAADMVALSAEYENQTSALDILGIGSAMEARLQEAIQENDLPKLLANYDNKGLMALAASHLKRTKLDAFESWLLRMLRNAKAPDLVAAIQAALPAVSAR